MSDADGVPTVEQLMAAIKQRTEAVLRLLEEPEYGLSTWNEMLAQQLKELRTDINALIGGRP